MPETEAEALLRSGALYAARIGLRRSLGALVFAGLKHGVFSVYDGDAPIVHFDLEGRWRRCYIEPTHYLRRLDGSTPAIDRPRGDRGMVLDRRLLDPEEAGRLDETIRSLAIDLVGLLESDATDRVAPPPPARALGTEKLRSILERIARWDAAAWAENRRRYAATYGPMPFVPPDCQEAIVLQATVGPGRVPAFGGEPGDPGAKSPEAFARHCREVADLLGLGAVPLRHLFLAGPGALRRPAAEVERNLRDAVATFPLADGPPPSRRSDLPIDRPHREGIQAILDRFEPPMPAVEDWRRFRTLGLRRVTLGVETGGAIPGADRPAPDDVRRVVDDLKASGIAVSLATLLGVGGRGRRNEHERGTVDLLGTLGLGAGDHVYLIDPADLSRASADADEPLAAVEVAEQERRLLDRLAPLRAERKVKVLPYTSRKQFPAGA